MVVFDTSAEIARQLSGQRLISAEMMYKPRPTDPRQRRVFDFTLDSRLGELSRHDRAAVLLICASEATADSLDHLPAAYPRLYFVYGLTNPQSVMAARDPYAETPARCGWDDPESWRRYGLTDRWARLLFALDVARQIDSAGYLALPAHDAVWGSGLLARLIKLSERHARNGLNAAVSPYTPYQHSPVPGVEIPREIIDALNATFARDSWLRWRMTYGRYQSFWGKMGLIPFGMSAEIVRRAETMAWEDDLEIDRVLREAGYGVRALWAGNAALYRQAPPVFDRAGLRKVIERTLHYSLNIPGASYGDKSLLNQPLDWRNRLRKGISPRFARALALSEALIAECNADIAARLDHCATSWVDWGAYRYAVRVGDPLVQVWKSERGLL